jgi:hypothetical protein
MADFLRPRGAKGAVRVGQSFTTIGDATLLQDRLGLWGATGHAIRRVMTAFQLHMGNRCPFFESEK